ncbi:Por secretion system C-terminal sorting domain-containing protein [Flavobacterium fluvii]|uniref:Por secretion system C-terminal sorting domain-containing protein n=1 Tax=Flavobacterium fluvii TaxID=468056 RepID=A0A1M5M8X2_9FLAO|nr:endonuclease [Flavobacterium fluvii]SHG73688.1 Por secretion system C-terminal sorting domain-containing protein [Flavobacterium fluvii]
MKLKLLFFALLISFYSFAQIPTGYYNSATGTGYTLKTQLYNIIAPHTELSYTPGLWDLYYTSDVRADGKVWDIYSNCNFIFGTFAATGGNQDNGTGGTVECDKYNREHTFPRSWFGGTVYPMYTDAFHVMPTDKKDNSMRGNMPYGKVGTSTFTTSNGSKIGNCVAPNTPASLTVFEPADQYKGDIARNYFYMATCYQNLIGSWQNLDPNGAKVLDGSNDKVYQQWYLDLMYSWHIADPVSTKETDRINAVYAVQGNRNPYIDHPEWVVAVWGTVLSNKNIEGLLANISVYPNPSKSNKISIETESELDEIQLVNINGQIVQKIVHPKANQKVYTLDNLKQGVYILKLNSYNKSTTKKIIIN